MPTPLAAALVAAGMTEIGAAVVAYAVVSVAMFAANMALSSVVGEDQPDIDTRLGEEGARGHLVNTSDTQAVLPRIYGRTRVGINRIYAGTSGTDNKYIHIVGTVGEGEVNGIAQTTGVDQLFLDEKVYTEFGTLVHYEFFTGASDQNVCATLNAAIPEWTDLLRRTAYIYVRLEYDSDVFQNLPEITLEVEGLKLYDPRDDSTIYNNNAALATRDLVLASSRRGGMGIASARMDEDTWKTVASYCDVTKDWTVGVPIRKQQAVIDNVSSLLSLYRGGLIYSENKFKARFKDLNHEASVMSLGEDDIVDEGISSLRVKQPSIFDTPNAVRVKFHNSEKKYQVDDYVLSDSAAIIADGDYREKTIELLGINSQANAMKMANYYLERFRVNKGAPLKAFNRAIALEPMDLIQLTHSFPGWTDKLMRVLNSVILSEDIVQLDLIEEEAAFYDDIYNLADHDWHDTDLPDPSASPYSVINVSHSEEVYYYRNRSFTRWKIDFDKPAVTDYPWWKHAEIWIKVGIAGEWKFMTKATTDYMLDPVEEGETYYCKMRSVSIHERKEDFDSAYSVSKQIVGRVADPANPSSFSATAAANVVTLTAEFPSDPDVVGYEIRMGDTWNGGSFVHFSISPNVRLTFIVPGTHTFWIAALDNAGVYSPAPRSASCTVPYPTNYDYKTEWCWDYDGIGSHDNTEYVVHEATDAVKCSHTGSVLNGTWTSPVYDAGSVKRMKIWGDFLSDFVAGDKTWDGFFPSPVTWDDKLDANTWNTVFAVEGSLSAKLKYGDVDVSENTLENFNNLAPEIDARYLQVELTINDPELTANLFVYELNMTMLTYT